MTFVEVVKNVLFEAWTSDRTLKEYKTPCFRNIIITYTKSFSLFVAVIFLICRRLPKHVTNLSQLPY